MGVGRTRRTLVLVLFFLGMLSPASVSAQVPVSDTRPLAEADSVFNEGLAAYEDGRFGAALARFEQAYQGYPLHRSTTAARLMAARAAYRAGRYDRAILLAEGFASSYPTSGYVDDMRSVLSRAHEAQSIERRNLLRLGVLLSRAPAQAVQVQEMFNGIRFAVDDYNRSHPDRPVRMLYRDTAGGADDVRAAVRELANSGVKVILGTVFSDQAVAAAAEAERQGVVFIAPLATDEQVTSGRSFAFQANPSIQTRGMLMAQFAVFGLRIDRLGVIAEESRQGVGVTLTDAFIEQASKMGAEINLVTLLPDSQSWLELDKIVSADTLSNVDALYMPLVTDEPVSLAGGIFSSLDRMNADVRVLGNSAWHDLPMVSEASAYTTTYSNDFFADPDRPAVRQFEQRYRLHADVEPGRIAYAGYDTATFLLAQIDDASGMPSATDLRQAGMFSGLGHRIHFEGKQINQALFYHRYRDGSLTLIR